MKPAPPVTSVAAIALSRLELLDLAARGAHAAGRVARVEDAPRVAHDRGGVERGVIRDDDDEIRVAKHLLGERRPLLHRPALEANRRRIRVVEPDRGALLLEEPDDVERRRLAGVAGVALVGGAEHEDL